MNVAEVMAELGGALRTVPALNVHSYWAARITPPAAIVEFPEAITFDNSMGRGADRVTIPVIVAVANVDARAATEELGAYANGSGPRSVKALVEAFDFTYADSARVQSAEFGVLTVAGTDYLACTFTIDVIGRGA